jgi:hypothetical protein
MEEFVLLLVGAVRTLQAADEQNRHTSRYQNSQHTRVNSQPVGHNLHSAAALGTRPKISAIATLLGNLLAVTYWLVFVTTIVRAIPLACKGIKGENDLSVLK